MRALITGASSGLGREMARILASRGYDLILVARREERLVELATTLPTATRVITHDLSREAECRILYEEIKATPIDVLVNNAGFGAFGPFADSPLERDLTMMRVNDQAPLILMKLYLKDFIARNQGRILNVASAAAFTTGPLLSVYYASKSFIYRLSLGIAEELRHAGSAVQISVLCPGPVKTEFDDVAQVKFSLKGQDAHVVAQKAIKGLLAGKEIIIPSFAMRLGKFGTRFASERLLARVGYAMQKKKA